MRLRILDQYKNDLPQEAFSYAYQATKQALEAGSIRAENIAMYFLNIAGKYQRMHRLDAKASSEVNHG